MKKTFFYSLFTICMLALAAGFTACSSDDEDINFYSFGILKFSQSGSVDEIATMSADMKIVENALSAEFNLAEGENTFQMKGDTNDADAHVIAKFNKALENVQIKGGWSGSFTYGIFVTRASGSSKTLADKTFTGSK